MKGFQGEFIFYTSKIQEARSAAQEEICDCSLVLCFGMFLDLDFGLVNTVSSTYLYSNYSYFISQEDILIYLGGQESLWP